MNSTNSTQADQEFLQGGFARTTYIDSPAWKDAYENLKSFSDQFVSQAWANGRHGYGWPLDPLHWWSRTWEYPFIAAYLHCLGSSINGARTLDIGAAVTFFSFYLLNQGFNLTNLDYDAAMPQHFSRAFEAVRGKLYSGKAPLYVVGDARDTKLDAESFDVVTCVSVLEHIPEWQRTIPEIHRLVAPGGYFVLTFDVRRDEQSNGLSLDDVVTILQLINERFEPLTRIEHQFPADVLTEDNAPMPTRIPPEKFEWSRFLPLSSAPGKAARMVRRLFQHPPPPTPENLAIYGGVWRKR